MDDMISRMLETLLVLILACILAAVVVLTIDSDLRETILTPGDGENRVDQPKHSMSEREINKQMNKTNSNLIDIERKLEYIDPDDYHNLSMLDGELKEIETELHDLNDEIGSLDDKPSSTKSIGSMNRRADDMERQIKNKKEAYYEDVLVYGLWGIGAGIVLCICVVALPYLQYRRGKLYGLIGHGGEREYARDRFIKFLYVAMAFGFIILVTGLILMMLRVVPI